MNLGSVTRSTQAYNAFQDRLEADATAAKKKPSMQAAKAVGPKYSFDPFDKKSWDVKPPKGSNVDTHA